MSGLEKVGALNFSSPTLTSLLKGGTETGSNGGPFNCAKKKKKMPVTRTPLSGLFWEGGGWKWEEGLWEGKWGQWR